MNSWKKLLKSETENSVKNLTMSEEVKNSERDCDKQLRERKRAERSPSRSQPERAFHNR